MPIPLRTQLFDSFLGVQEGIHSLVLPDLYSPGGSRNLYIDKFGRAKRIDGYDNVNGTAITTSGGGSAVNVPGLFAYRSLSGGSTTHRLRAVVDDGTNEWEVWGSSNEGGTWSLLTDFGAGSVGAIPDYAQFGDEGYLVNGVIAAQVDNGTALSAAGSTQSPTVSAAAGSAGGLLGTYKWKLVSIETDGSRHAGSVASTAVQLENAQASLTWTADADTDVVGYELYRTTGTGGVYYFVAYIDGRTTAAYTDTAPDLLILENRLLQEHGDPPPVGIRFVEPYAQRLWWGGTSANPRMVYPSDPGLPASVLLENGIDLTDAETVGDALTGMHGGFEGTIVCFEQFAIWTISGTGQVIGNILDWTRTRTNARVGTPTIRSVARVSAGSVYTDQKGRFQTTAVSTLVYFTPFLDLRLFDGDNDLIISTPVAETLRTVNPQALTAVHALDDPERNQITWYVPTGSSTVPDTAITWNYAFGVWHVWTPQPFLSSLRLPSPTTGTRLLVGEASRSTGGYIYELWSGTSFNGTGIAGRWMTKTLYGVDDHGRPDLSSTKRWRWIDLLTQQLAGVAFTIEWLPGNVPDDSSAAGSVTITPAASTLESASGSTVQSSDGSALSVAVASAMIHVQLEDQDGRYLHHEGLRLRITDDGSVQDAWAIEGLMLAFQPLPGLKRRANI